MCIESDCHVLGVKVLFADKVDCITDQLSYRDVTCNWPKLACVAVVSVKAWGVRWSKQKIERGTFFCSRTQTFKCLTRSLSKRKRLRLSQNLECEPERQEKQHVCGQSVDKLQPV